MKVCRYLHAYPSALFVVAVMYGFAHCSTYMCKFVGSKGIFPKNTEIKGQTNPPFLIPTFCLYECIPFLSCCRGGVSKAKIVQVDQLRFVCS